MKDCFSVGEVCKIKGISVGSLRYYEELELLVPVYVNPSNGYRYYSHQQMVYLDVILTCIDLDIPLKDVKQYFSPVGHIDLASIQKMGEEIAEKKMEKIKGHLAMFEFWTKHGEETEEILRQDKRGKSCKKQEKTRHFYCLPYEWNQFYLGEYEKIYAEMTKQLREQPTGFGFEEGILLKKIRGKYQCFVFCQVSKGMKGKTMTIPSGVYSSELVVGSTELMKKITSIEEKSDILLGRFLFHHQFKPEKQYFELQKRVVSDDLKRNDP